MFYGNQFQHFDQLKQATHQYIDFLIMKELKPNYKACLLKITEDEPSKLYTKSKYNF